MTSPPHSNLNSLPGSSIRDTFLLALFSLATLVFLWLLEHSDSFLPRDLALSYWTLPYSAFLSDCCMTGLFLSFRHQHLKRPFLTTLPEQLSPLSYHPIYHCLLYEMYLPVCYCLSPLTRTFHEFRDLVLFTRHLQCPEQCLTYSSCSMNTC